ncbi:MAG: UvrD-helicase domain-containing protein [Halieaceae bacterium]|nr:UvrD-helicase domain-containing protein [Halieaceae bacterium]
MSNPVTDSTQRTAALDPLRSFCVTAPAGSGKTELLIQRTLNLLARVEQPQEVLAITFTRKAAAEMRSRLGAALDAAATQPCPEDAHAAHTWQLARAALEVDRVRGWELRRNPAQLNIRTIDGFCGALTRQMPILSRFGGPVAAVDDAFPYYREATRLLLERLVDPSPVADDLGKLLLQFDNNWARLEELLVAMLACRDQWLVYLGTGLDRDSAQAAAERSITVLCESSLAELAQAIEPWRAALIPLWQYSRDNRGRSRDLIWPGQATGDVPAWQDLATMLLTGKDQWRRSVTKREGFPAGKGEAAERKAEFVALLDDVAEHEGLRSRLAEVRHLPSTTPGDAHWELVLACTRLLPLLAAQLSVVFQQHGVVDHTQVSLAALDALGPDDRPTELALKLDYQLRHILVDEFQDTAVNQFELVRRLTRGWAEHNAENPDAARTLFIVGDGMQSIYGFRDADVGLFIKAKQAGFDALRLEPLTLSTNFRSQAGLVHWVNDCFASAFPASDDIQRGEIAFSPAQPFRSGLEQAASTVAAFADAEAEAHWLAAEIESAVNAPDCDSVAVLVRRKADLLALIPELKGRGISWQAQEIDALADSMVVRDLATLCRALHNPLDRVAWFGLLRAPWCGLEHADLLALAQLQPQGSLKPLLLAPEPAAQLSADGKARLSFLRAALKAIVEQQERLSLRDWIEFAWLTLQGPDCVEDASRLEDADAFLVMLQHLEATGEAYSPTLLDQQVARLFACSTSAESGLQLMTLHKAKGLEFDRVFIPNLAHSPRGERRDLLLWDEFHAADGDDYFMLAMDDEADSSEATLYNYLYRQRKQKRRAEATRLLYVGATRAIQRLYLTARLDRSEDGDVKPPSDASLLGTIWPSVARQVQFPERAAAVSTPVAEAPESLQRLAEPPTLPEPDRTAEDADPNIPELRSDGLASAVGSVVHLTLERLSQAELPDTFQRADWEAWWSRELAALGVYQREAALDRVAASVAGVLADERGRWLLSRDREDAASELALSRLNPDGSVTDFVIDRTYIHDKQRWVVDYKSSVPDSGVPVEQFVAQEAERYRDQLDGYRELMLAMGEKTVRCALYFTSIPCWHELD